MARIAGINIPQNKLVHIGLTYIYGIGEKNSNDICRSLEIPETKRVNELTDDEILKIREFIEKISLSLTHIHPNNYGPLDNAGNPTVIEMTFEKKPIADLGENNLPNTFDQPCDPEKKEIELTFSAKH